MIITLRMLSISNIAIDSDVFLSPMAGISDSPYRRLCRSMGSGFSFSEFVSAEGIVRKNPVSLSMLRFHDDERPMIFQLFGADEKTIVEAACAAEQTGPDVIDLNMGCSAVRIAHRGAGAGLLRDPLKAGRIIAALRKSLRVPVTAKIRLGWDEKNRNYLEVAKILEENGACMISVHGRTKTQAYRGAADWEAIGEIKASVSVPVLGCGDVSSFEDAAEKKKKFGVDGILIGRHAIGNPWIFSGKVNEFARVEIVSTMRKHFTAYCDHYGRNIIYSFRKFASRYLRGFEGAAELRLRFLTCEKMEEFYKLCELYEQN